MKREMTKEIKLVKVSADTAKLYEKAGFGHIANELPFQCRVQQRIRDEKKIHIVIFSKSQESWMARVVKQGQNLEDGYYLEDGISYEDILEQALFYTLSILVTQTQYGR